MGNCPVCNSQTKDLRCWNISCEAYSCKVVSKPEPAEIECPECEGEGRYMVAKLYPNGHTELWEECEECVGDGIIVVDYED